MPIKDPERKREVTKAWRQRVMPQGYGRWLYQRRKLRFQDAEEFRTALEWIADHHTEDRYGDSAALEMQEIARRALRDSRQREDDLGAWTPPEES